ncbi:tRNA 2-thiocytidine(32) synthetase TtcA [Thiomicrorhabdus hydrogeniphila]
MTEPARQTELNPDLNIQTNSKLSKKERTKDWITPPKSIMKLVGRAMAQYKMLRDGDRVLLGLSGGKDSMALLVILKHLQRHAPIKFDLAACTIDPEIPGFDPSPLKEWCAKMDVAYFYESEDMVGLAEERMKGDSFCSFCARQKRGILYATCRREGYNVLALAQHLDDLAESFIMSAFNAGQLRTMKAHYLNDDEDVRIIRPLVRVRENQTRDFATSAKLPVIEDNCPACYAKPQARAETKELLLAQEQKNKHLYANLWRAMQPLIEDDNHAGQANLTTMTTDKSMQHTDEIDL